MRLRNKAVAAALVALLSLTGVACGGGGEKGGGTETEHESE